MQVWLYAKVLTQLHNISKVKACVVPPGVVLSNFNGLKFPQFEV